MLPSALRGGEDLRIASGRVRGEALLSAQAPAPRKQLLAAATLPDAGWGSKAASPLGWPPLAALGRPIRQNLSCPSGPPSPHHFLLPGAGLQASCEALLMVTEGSPVLEAGRVSSGRILTSTHMFRAQDGSLTFWPFTAKRFRSQVPSLLRRKPL